MKQIFALTRQTLFNIGQSGLEPRQTALIQKSFLRSQASTHLHAHMPTYHAHMHTIACLHAHNKMLTCTQVDVHMHKTACSQANNCMLKCTKQDAHMHTSGCSHTHKWMLTCTKLQTHMDKAAGSKSHHCMLKELNANTVHAHIPTTTCTQLHAHCSHAQNQLHAPCSHAHYCMLTCTYLQAQMHTGERGHAFSCMVLVTCTQLHANMPTTACSHGHNCMLSSTQLHAQMHATIVLYMRTCPQRHNHMQIPASSSHGRNYIHAHK